MATIWLECENPDCGEGLILRDENFDIDVIDVYEKKINISKYCPNCNKENEVEICLSMT